MKKDDACVMADVNTMEKGEQGSLLYGVPNQSNVAGPVVVMVEEPPQQGDCFLWSVVGYLLCPVFGLCAMYYAARANYSADLKAEKTIIDRHYNRASLCTVMSIIFGIIIIVIIGVMLWKDPEKLDNPILLRLLRLYRP